jgi:Cu(I)/Ag(I) efflux system membrane fusion protein
MKPGTALAVLLAVAAGVGGGILLERQVLSAQDASQAAGTGPRILYWWDPMIPDYKSDKPGKSPMGMDMVPVYEGQDQAKAEETGVVTVSAAAMNNLGVRTAAVERTWSQPSRPSAPSPSTRAGPPTCMSAAGDGSNSCTPGSWATMSSAASC